MASSENYIEIEPLAGPFEIVYDDLPGSKSITNRALLLAALADGTSTLTNVLFSDDSKVMLAALKELGFKLDVDETHRRVTVEGRGGEIPSKKAELFLGNAGTAMRFLTAACCLGHGEYVLKGIPRMHERPIGQLVDALRQLGAEIEYIENEGYPPLRIRGKGLTGGETEIPRMLSSQFISALLQVGPLTEQGVSLVYTGGLISEPYIQMTRYVMVAFGREWKCEDTDERWTTPLHRRMLSGQGSYRACDLFIEPDASNASYFLAAAALAQSRCRMYGLGMASIQGDARFDGVLSKMGSKVERELRYIELKGGDDLRGIDINLNTMPDMAQTLAVVALFAEGPTVIRDVGNLRVKETDRMEALRVELSKLGAAVEINGDDIHITPPAGNVLINVANGKPMSADNPVHIDTYDDHRMAMAFSIAGLRQPGLRINDPACVNKTFPEYFEYLERLQKHVKKG